MPRKAKEAVDLAPGEIAISTLILIVLSLIFIVARLLDEAGVDVILVGDSLGMVIQGQETTLSATLDDSLTKATAPMREPERILRLSTRFRHPG